MLYEQRLRHSLKVIHQLYHNFQNLKCLVLGYILFTDEYDSVVELVPQLGHQFPKGYMMHVCKRDFHTDIIDKRMKYNIPPELVVNADQTPSSYV